MLIGPIHGANGLTRFAILFHRGPGSNQGYAWNDTDGEWQTLEGGTAAEFQIDLTEYTLDSEAWSAYSAGVPSDIPAGSHLRAIVFTSPDTFVAQFDLIAAPPFSAVVVDASRTWPLEKQSDGYRSEKTIVLQPGFSGTLAVDFAHVLNAGTGIASLDTVTDEAAESPGISIANLSVAQNLQAAHFDVASITTGKNYRLKVTITTTDGQTLPADVLLTGSEAP